MSGPYVVGVDVGLTKIMAGVVDCGSGHVAGVVKLPPAARAELPGAVHAAVAQALAAWSPEDGAAVAAIGVALPGLVDAASGALLPGRPWDHVAPLPLAAPLAAAWDRPVTLSAKAEAAARGESRFGAARGAARVACVFLGSEVEGVLLEDGERYAGATGRAGAVGHLMVRAGGRLCRCGQRGHLEAYVARGALAAMIREAVASGVHSPYGETLRDPAAVVKSRPLADAVASEDPAAVQVVAKAGLHLGVGLATLINLWNPGRVVLGGGIVDRIDLLFSVAVEQARAAALPAAVDGVEIVRAGLGDLSGVVGAALQAQPAAPVAAAAYGAKSIQ